MPGIEGIELIMDLRRIDKNARIVAMSGAAQSGGGSYLTIANKLGAQHTLIKPFSPHEFLTVVSAALQSETQNNLADDSDLKVAPR